MAEPISKGSQTRLCVKHPGGEREMPRAGFRGGRCGECFKAFLAEKPKGVLVDAISVLTSGKSGMQRDLRQEFDQIIGDAPAP